MLNWKNIIPIIIIIILSFGFYKFAHDWLTTLEKEYTYDTFESSAKEHVSLINEKIEEFIENIEQLAVFVTLHPAVGRFEFERYADSLTVNNRGFQALEYVEIVDSENLQQFIEKYQKYYPDFSIKILENNQLIPDNTNRETVYPIVFAHPYQENHRIIGYDPFRLDGRMEALLNAQHNRKISLSKQVMIFQRADETSFLIFSPAYHLTEKGERSSVKGFAEGVFVLSELIARSTRNLTDRNFFITIRDESDDGNLLINNYSLNTNNSTKKVAHSSILSYKDELVFADRKWSVVIESNEANFTAPLHSVRTTSLFLLLLLSAILLYLFYLVYSLSKSNRNLNNNKELLRENLDKLTESQNEIIYQANHDALTNLQNRNAVERSLNNLLKNATKESPLVLALIDIDNFKIINDAYGIEAGNFVIQQLAEFLEHRLHDSGAVYRVGVDEFLMVFENIEKDKAKRMAVNQLKAIQELKHAWKGYMIPVRASAGFTVISSRKISTSEIFSQLTTANFIAKEKGGNRLYQFNPKDSENANFYNKTNWINILSDAIDNERFVLRVQKIKNLKGGTDHNEVLISLLDETGNISSNMEFISAAERLHMMSSIDLWVVNRVIKYIADKQSNEHWAINLSGASLNDDVFRSELLSVIAQAKIDLSKIIFEITETSAINNFVVVNEFIKTCKYYGCKFSLDDFGSGMSSYAYLRDLPVGYIKVDGSFITRMLESELDYTIARGICDLSKQLDIETVAEFVENEAIYNKVVEMGFDYAQGYFIEKPKLLE